MVGMTRALICDPIDAGQGAGGPVRRYPRLHRLQLGLHRPFPARRADFLHPASRDRPLSSAMVARPRRRSSRPCWSRAAARPGLQRPPPSPPPAAIASRSTRRPRSGSAARALLAQPAPRRLEFGGIVTNLTREAELAGVAVIRRTRVDRALVERERPDVVIAATGATPRRPDLPGAETAHSRHRLAGAARGGQCRRFRAGGGLALRLDRHGRGGEAGAAPAAGCASPSTATCPASASRPMSATMGRRAPRSRRRGHPLCRSLRRRRPDRLYLAHVTGKEPIIVEGVDIAGDLARRMTPRGPGGGARRLRRRAPCHRRLPDPAHCRGGGAGQACAPAGRSDRPARPWASRRPGSAEDGDGDGQDPVHRTGVSVSPSRAWPSRALDHRLHAGQRARRSWPAGA